VDLHSTDHILPARLEDEASYDLATSEVSGTAREGPRPLEGSVILLDVRDTHLRTLLDRLHHLCLRCEPLSITYLPFDDRIPLE